MRLLPQVNYVALSSHYLQIGLMYHLHFVIALILPLCILFYFVGEKKNKLKVFVKSGSQLLFFFFGQRKPTWTHTYCSEKTWTQTGDGC